MKITQVASILSRFRGTVMASGETHSQKTKDNYRSDVRNACI